MNHFPAFVLIRLDEMKVGKKQQSPRSGTTHVSHNRTRLEFPILEVDISTTLQLIAAITRTRKNSLEKKLIFLIQAFEVQGHRILRIVVVGSIPVVNIIKEEKTNVVIFIGSLALLW